MRITYMYVSVNSYVRVSLVCTKQVMEWNRRNSTIPPAYDRSGTSGGGGGGEELHRWKKKLSLRSIFPQKTFNPSPLPKKKTKKVGGKSKTVEEKQVNLLTFVGPSARTLTFTKTFARRRDMIASPPSSLSFF